MFKMSRITKNYDDLVQADLVIAKEIQAGKIQWDSCPITSVLVQPAGFVVQPPGTVYFSQGFAPAAIVTTIGKTVQITSYVTSDQVSNNNTVQTVHLYSTYLPITAFPCSVVVTSSQVDVDVLAATAISALSPNDLAITYQNNTGGATYIGLNVCLTFQLP